MIVRQGSLQGQGDPPNPPVGVFFFSGADVSFEGSGSIWVV